MSSSLWPHGLQHIRLTCPPLSPGLCYSCPLSWGCYLTISSSAAHFPFCFPSFPASGSFPVSWVFTLDGQSIGASSSASVLPKNIQGWSFRIVRFDLLAVQGTLKSLFQHHNLKASILEVGENQLLLHLCGKITSCRATKATECRRNHQIPKNGTKAGKERVVWSIHTSHSQTVT